MTPYFGWWRNKTGRTMGTSFMADDPMTQPQRRLPWLDLATTGFTELFDYEVYDHLILEIGAAVTDENFNVLASTSIVIQHLNGLCWICVMRPSLACTRRTDSSMR